MNICISISRYRLRLIANDCKCKWWHIDIKGLHKLSEIPQKPNNPFKRLTKCYSVLLFYCHQITIFLWCSGSRLRGRWAQSGSCFGLQSLCGAERTLQGKLWLMANYVSWTMSPNAPHKLVWATGFPVQQHKHVNTVCTEALGSLAGKTGNISRIKYNVIDFRRIVWVDALCQAQTIWLQKSPNRWTAEITQQFFLQSDALRMLLYAHYASASSHGPGGYCSSLF